MRNLVTTAGFVLVLAVGAYGVFGGLQRGGNRPTARTNAAATGAGERGRATGSFDPKMSGVCQFSCAASQPFDEEDLAVQPGVPSGGLTRCPVSGVVFVVDAQRPRVPLVTGDYALCCDGCAKKFWKDPGRFVSL
jgi:hypothetical protein